MRSNSGKVLPVVLVVLAVLIVAGTVGAIFYVDHLQGQKYKNTSSRIPVGFFMGVDNASEETLDRYAEYDVVALNPEEYDTGDIGLLKIKNVSTMAYINLAVADTSADYFKDSYKDLVLDAYKGSKDKVWMDITNHTWEDYVLAKVGEITAKGFDAYLVDGCDIYFYATNRAGADKVDSGAVRDSIIQILKEMKRRHKKVYIMNADTFISYCLRNNESVADLFDGICQESAFTVVDPETGKFEEAPGITYYEAYLKKCANAGLYVSLLEYSKDPAVKAKIKAFCEENGYDYYIAESAGLD